MANIYIALNGDDVGSRIGEAIANDDHEGLASATSAIEGAHGNIDQWVESVGGKKVTRSGDEGIYLIPEKALGSLESIKGSYKEQSGHGLTIGVGSSMSEASKALIYGKLNGKDQVVHYDPSIEDYLSEQDVSDEEIPEELPEKSGDESSEESPAPEEGGEDSLESNGLPAKAKKPSPKMADAKNNLDGSVEENGDDEEQEAQPGNENLKPKSASVAPSNDLSEDNGEESEESEDNGEESEESEDNGEESEESESEEEGLESEESEEDPANPDAPGSKAIDGDIDGKDFGADKDDSDEEAQEEEAANAGSDMNMAPKNSPVESESAYKDINEDDMSNPDMDLGNESYEDGDELTSMIHGDMESEDSSPEDSSPEDSSPEDGSPESGLDDELRQDIASALMAFKENKDMLEQAREQNPKLYQATITMLRSMIEMAKKLGQNPAQDLQDQEGEQQLNEEFPAAEDQQLGDEEENASQPEADQGMIPNKGKPAEKK